MDFKTIIKNFAGNYITIYAGSMFATFVFCSIFQKDANFTLSYFRWMLLFSLAGDLPLFIFYSRKELTETQWLIRKILHFIVLECVLLSFGYFLKLYRNCAQAIFFAILVLLVYMLVWCICYQVDKQQAMKMNQRLKELKCKKER